MFLLCRKKNTIFVWRFFCNQRLLIYIYVNNIKIYPIKKERPLVWNSICFTGSVLEQTFHLNSDEKKNDTHLMGQTYLVQLSYLKYYKIFSSSPLQGPMYIPAQYFCTNSSQKVVAMYCYFTTFWSSNSKIEKILSYSR